MRPVSTCLVLVLLLAAGSFASPSQGAPTQDDAGTGGDAPDAGPGVLLSPGTYSGTLVVKETPLQSQDREDWYAFHLAAGDRVTISVSILSVNATTGARVDAVLHTPSGRVAVWHAASPTGALPRPTMTIPVATSGTWGLRVTGASPGEYRYEFTVGTSPQPAPFVVEEGVAHVAFRHDAPPGGSVTLRRLWFGIARGPHGSVFAEGEADADRRLTSFFVRAKAVPGDVYLTTPVVREEFVVLEQGEVSLVAGILEETFAGDGTGYLVSIPLLDDSTTVVEWTTSGGGTGNATSGGPSTVHALRGADFQGGVHAGTDPGQASVLLHANVTAHRALVGWLNCDGACRVTAPDGSHPSRTFSGGPGGWTFEITAEASRGYEDGHRLASADVLWPGP